MAARRKQPALALHETVTDAARSGEQRRALIALRDGLAKAFDDAEPNMLPQISGQLRAVLADIAALPAEKKATPTDEIRARREARRRATPAGAAIAARGRK